MCIHRSEDGTCKKFSVDGCTSYCMDGPCEYEQPSWYDRIVNMSIDELAQLFYYIIHERDLHLMKALDAEGIEASLVGTSPEVAIARHKQWLESEADG